MAMRVARSVVTISSTAPDGKLLCHCTGIIMSWNQANKRARILTSSLTVCEHMGTLYDPKPKLCVCLPDGTSIEGQVLFFNAHYDVALLEIMTDLPLQPTSFGSRPNYGQDVFVLGRDKKFSLMARRGTILWRDGSFLFTNHYMFLSCNIPGYDGRGGPVVDHDGNVIGMALRKQYPAVVSISTIMTCIEMWTQFSRVTYPLHGMRLKAVELLDISLREELSRDYNIDHGFVVEGVNDDCNAEEVGIRTGDVVVFCDLGVSTVHELEDCLLSLGWSCLRGASWMVDLKLEVHDLQGPLRGNITLPLPFTDASELEDMKDI